MPDLSSAVAGIADLVLPLIRALLRTTAGMIVLTIVLAFGAYRLVDPLHSPLRSAGTVLVVLALGAVLGGMLALKRAVLTALRYGVERMKLGERTVGALFTRMANLPGAQSVRLIPLARAEALLRDAVSGLYKEGESSGFFRVHLHRALVERIEALTLARFRAEGEEAGGIDLTKVRDELVVKSDELLCRMFDTAMLKLTVVVLLGLIAAVTLIVLFVRYL